MLDTKLTNLRLSNWCEIMSNTNFITFHRIDLICFTIKDILFAHVQFNATIFFNVFIKFSFWICRCQ